MTKGFAILAITAWSCVAIVVAQKTSLVAIPKTWDESAIADMEIPLPPPAPKPSHVSEAYYYAIPEITIYKTYTRTPPSGTTPDAYLEWLKQQEPVVAFDQATLKSEDDWIRAGELVFRTTLKPAPYQPNAGQSFVIRKKGVVESTIGTCASCHSQRQPDGTFALGAPSTNPSNLAFGGFPPPGPERTRSMRLLFSTPWAAGDPNVQLDPSISGKEVVGWRIPAGGIVHRAGSSLTYPVQIPSLFGLKDRKYFDHSGRHRHRSIGDVMRYAALADISYGLELYQRYGDFIPGADDYRTLPDPKSLVRFSDAHLYALSLYLYSLKPPSNPNRPDSTSTAGEQVFRREGCATCHTPPLYTNNKLIPADGFTVPAEHRAKYDILDVRIGLDAYSTLHTRRGSGYYKVPSLKELWLRPVLEHNGSVTTLEEWFDPRRLSDEFVPTGFKGPRKTRAVKGHRFGLKLSDADKKALIAFLRTL